MNALKARAGQAVVKNVYELKPVNFFNLQEEERAAVLSSFLSILNSLTTLASFYIITDVSEVKVGSYLIRQPYKRYFLETDESLDGILASSGLRFVKLLEVPRPKVKGGVRNFMVLEDGRLARAFNAYGLPSKLAYGFLTRYYDIADEIRLDVRPVPDAERLVERQYRALYAKYQNLSQVDAKTQLYVQSLDSARAAVASGTEKLFEVRLVLAVIGKGYEELRDKSLRLIRLLDFAEAPSRVQPAVFNLQGPQWATGRWLYITSSGLLPFFPFAGMDLVDQGGTFIGQNLQTGNAVIFNVFERDNYNVSVLGLTGYGKSMFIKAFLSRAAQADDRSFMFIFDSIVKPEYVEGADGKYESSLAYEVGARAVRFTDPSATYGLDPLIIFPKREASRFLMEMAGIDERSDEALEVHDLARGARRVDDLLAGAKDALRERLEAGLEPFLRFFWGDFEVYDRMAFALSDITSPMIRDAVAFLILGAIWEVIKRQPLGLKKYLVVDEGWAFVETNSRTGKPYFPLAVEYIPEIARTGRHYSTAFIVATQLVSDFLGGPGRTLFENSATKVVLRQDPASLKLLRESLSLSEEEARLVLSAKPGQGILITPEGHVPFYNQLMPDEMKRFTTRAV